MLDTEVVKSVGGWDMRFNKFPFAFEEIDVSYSLFKKGYNLYLDVGAEMFHLRSRKARLQIDKEDRKKFYEELEQRFIKKHEGV